MSTDKYTGPQTKISLSDLVEGGAIGTIIFTTVLQSIQNATCTWQERNYFFGYGNQNLAYWPALMIPARLSAAESFMQRYYSTPGYEIIRHGIVLRVKVDTMQDKIQQIYGGNTNYNYAFVYIGGKPPAYALGARPARVYQGGAGFYLPFDTGALQQTFGNLVVGVIKPQSVATRDNYLIGNKEWYNPKTTTPCGNQLSPQNTVLNWAGILATMPNYSAQMATSPRVTNPILGSGPSLGFVSETSKGPQVIIKDSALGYISEDSPSLWFPELILGGPISIIEDEIRTFQLVTFLPSMVGSFNKSLLYPLLEKLAPELADVIEIGDRTAIRWGKILGSNAIIGAPIFVASECGGNCYEPSFVGMVNGVESNENSGAIYQMLKFSIPDNPTLSWAMNLANSFGASNFFNSTIKLLATIGAVLQIVTSQLGSDVINNLGTEGHDIVSEIVSEGVQAGKSIETIANDVTNDIKNIFKWL